MFCANTAYVMRGPLLKQLAAFLNSSLITWYVNKTAVTSGMGTARWIAYVVEGIPVPKSVPEGLHLEGLVDDLLRRELDEGSAYFQEIEPEIEAIVYESYGITKEEKRELEELLRSTQCLDLST